MMNLLSNIDILFNILNYQIYNLIINIINIFQLFDDFKYI